LEATGASNSEVSSKQQQQQGYLAVSLSERRPRRLAGVVDADEALQEKRKNENNKTTVVSAGQRGMHEADSGPGSRRNMNQREQKRSSKWRNEQEHIQ
jgi:hypothetical protein